MAEYAPVSGYVGNAPEDTSCQIRVLTLNEGEHLDSTLYRLQKGWRLQLVLGPSLLGRNVTLLVNMPGLHDPPFLRTLYHSLEWHVKDGGCATDSLSWYTELELRQAGPFSYIFYEEGNTSPSGSGSFVVDPVLMYGCNEVLPLNCVQCQTVISKCLGPMNTWEKKLLVSRESGYNMVHFTPIQKLGMSNSGYSINDQRKLNINFNYDNRVVTIDEIKFFTSTMRRQWKVLSVCDIVLNHTSNDSPWLMDHPESSYNLVNTPHLIPAYLLDAVLHHLTIDVSKGQWESLNIPPQVCTEDHVLSIRNVLHDHYLPQVNIGELYALDIGAVLSEFLLMARSRLPPVCGTLPEKTELQIIQDPQYRRLKSTIDMELALCLYNVYRNDCYDEETRIRKCTEELKVQLEAMNKVVLDKVKEHLDVAVNNCLAGIRYERLNKEEADLLPVSQLHPLVPRYFSDDGMPKSLKEHSILMYTAQAKFVMAHNGWVMGSNSTRNFVAPGDNTYLRRELVAWGDSVKLRYGEQPDDSPFLWSHMLEYVKEVSRVFDGIRLDNCHSTPLPVAEYMLDAARRIKPDLYVIAELFTNSDLKDNIFVNRLGITSLIREATKAWDSHEQGRLVHRYGGESVGAFYQPILRPLEPCVAHALFMDMTHDNQSPIEKRSVWDLLPSSALVAMACCASGSNRGYDEMVPHHIHVVNENREYAAWADGIHDRTAVNFGTGIISAKKALNKLHYVMGQYNYTQVYVDQINKDVVSVTRHCPATHRSVVLVAYTAFSPPTPGNPNFDFIKPLRVEGNIEEVILEARTIPRQYRPEGDRFTVPQPFVRHSKIINGMPDFEVRVAEHISLSQSLFLVRTACVEDNITQLNFKDFVPGSIVAIRVAPSITSLGALKGLKIHIKNFIECSFPKNPTLDNIVTRLTLKDLNKALYRCAEEENDNPTSSGAYCIPSHGHVVYCGIQGFESLLSEIRPTNELGHPMCKNLREGNWMIDYVHQRMIADPGTRELGLWLRKNLEPLKLIPRYLIPSYFDVIISGLHRMLVDQCWKRMSPFVMSGSSFVRSLALGSVQCCGEVNSAQLPPLSSSLTPRAIFHNVTLSAGLPHFTKGYMRNWGRDTFIALRGLLILTGRYPEARCHILAYAGCLRHGLIPNLLDGGVSARFNCRDAVWWWLYCIKCYCQEVPNGFSILQDRVARIFPTDSSPATPSGTVDQPLACVMQEALTVHFQGLCFRERNAGPNIDAHMLSSGFNNQIGVNPETGFVFGGNAWNCGTWMDKMGSNTKAGNRGKPATPRDGSAVELVGLSKCALRWLADISDKGLFPHNSVTRNQIDGTVITWTYREWEQKVEANFEPLFFIPLATEEEAGAPTNPKPIHRRNIYKDTYGASSEWGDYQLRCNFPIAMVVAPEMFNPQNAWNALKMIEELLLGPLGIKTLDPSDWAYNGTYDNDDDSDDPKTASGFNYHQGPEWVWPLGFYLRAKLHFARLVGGADELMRTATQTRALLARHLQELRKSPWRGLPELTNENGAYCNASCRTQAWSMGCLLEVLKELNEAQQKIVLEEGN